MQVLLAALEHAFDIPAFPILADDLVFIHFSICAQETDPLSGVCTVRKIDQLGRYPLDDFVLILDKKVDLDAEFPCSFATALFAHGVQGFDVDHFPVVLVILLRVRFEPGYHSKFCLFHQP